ncbi:hypothetical protein LSAT2_013811 [Lamellibrachia satsuma]|nr:hypothetical protein LSAT2_013811 [Lamellibrachia satsuma]
MLRGIVLTLLFGIAILLMVAVTLIPRSGTGDRGDFPSPKTWWTKKISSDLYTAGRLTERQIKYAADAGFRTIVSLIEFPNSYDIGDDRVLSTTASRDVAERLAGITFEVLVKSKAEVPKMETVRKFATIMSRAAKPVLLHCVTAYTASFMALTYLGYNKQMNSLHIYSYGSRLGYDFTSKAPFRNLISNVTGEPPLTNPPTPDVTIRAWNKKYWLMKPVYKNWFMAGQIQSNYEEVTLLNIRDNTGTYEETGRQSTERLQASRIDPARRNEYISPDSTVNYERKNILEYGDDIGYNAALEKHDMKSNKFTYHQTPPYNSKRDMKGMYTPSAVKAYLTTWLVAGQEASVCVHSQSGYRAAVVALISAARQYDLDSAWAVERARQLGYPFDEEPGQPMVKLFQDVLRPPK